MNRNEQSRRRFWRWMMTAAFAVGAVTLMAGADAGYLRPIPQLAQICLAVAANSEADFTFTKLTARVGPGDVFANVLLTASTGDAPDFSTAILVGEAALADSAGVLSLRLDPALTLSAGVKHWVIFEFPGPELASKQASLALADAGEAGPSECLLGVGGTEWLRVANAPIELALTTDAGKSGQAALSVSEAADRQRASGALETKWFSKLAAASGPRTNLVSEEPEPRGTAIELSPNPFNPTLSLRLEVAQPTHARIAVYDVRGRQVRVLMNENLGSGPHVLTFDAKSDDGSHLASGVYFIRSQIGGKQFIRRVTLLK